MSILLALNGRCIVKSTSETLTLGSFYSSFGIAGFI
jgi:hypothetical protein